MSVKSSISKRKIIYGFGINDANYVTNPIINGKRICCPFYKKWQNMIKRCYNLEYLQKHKTYQDVYIDEEWKYFSNFRTWMEKQDWEGKHLDKDILYPGNKIYCPDKCIFVTQEINKLILKSDKVRGKYPLGVSYIKKRDRYMSYYGCDSKLINLGWYEKPFEAHRKYQIEKSRYIKEVAIRQTDERLKNALIRISNGIIEDYENGVETVSYR